MATHRLLKDIAIRLGGIGLVLLSASAFHWLRSADPRGQATLGQLAIAAIGFLSASLGLGLTILGYAIHDPVEISDRWRPRI